MGTREKFLLLHKLREAMAEDLFGLHQGLISRPFPTFYPPRNQALDSRHFAGLPSLGPKRNGPRVAGAALKAPDQGLGAEEIGCLIN